MHRQLVPVNAESVRKRLHRYEKAARRRGAAGGGHQSLSLRSTDIASFSTNRSVQTVVASFAVQHSF
jgi:hypothetical protein